MDKSPTLVELIDALRGDVDSLREANAANWLRGFSRPSDLPETRCEAGFSAMITGSGKIQFSGAAEWLEAAVDRRFPRKWIADYSSNLSCRTFPSVAAARH